MPDIKLRPFKPRWITPDRILLFVGKRGSGKTTCERDIVWNFRYIPTGVVYSPTEDANGDWEGTFPDTFIYDGYNPDASKRILRRQRMQARKHRLDPEHVIQPTLMVCEDCMYDRKVFNSDISARGIIMNGRHLNIILLISIQYLMDISRCMRTQADYIFIFKDNDIGNRERIWKNWGGVVPTFEAFSAILSQATNDNCCLVIDNTSLSDKIEDCLFWYKAVNRKKGSFKFGSRAYWLYHYANTRPREEYEDDGDDDDGKGRYRVKKLR